MKKLKNLKEIIVIVSYDGINQDLDMEETMKIYRDVNEIF